MIKENEVLVIDDFISTEYQEQIKNTLIGEELFNGHEFSWHYIDDVMSNPSNEAFICDEMDIHNDSATSTKIISPFTHGFY